MSYYEIIPAFRNGDRDECVRLINTDEINVHFIDYGYLSRSLIHWACFHGHLDVIQLLISKGANPHDKNSSGWSLLMEASRNGHIDIVEFLVSRGANINYVCDYGWNSLMLASARGNIRIVQYLLNQGAEIHHKSQNGKTCIDVAKDENIKSILMNWPIIMLIIVSEELYIYSQLAYLFLDLQEYL